MRLEGKISVIFGPLYPACLCGIMGRSDQKTLGENWPRSVRTMAVGSPVLSSQWRVLRKHPGPCSMLVHSQRLGEWMAWLEWLLSRERKELNNWHFAARSFPLSIPFPSWDGKAWITFNWKHGESLKCLVTERIYKRLASSTQNAEGQAGRLCSVFWVSSCRSYFIY